MTFICIEVLNNQSNTDNFPLFFGPCYFSCSYSCSCCDAFQKILRLFHFFTENDKYDHTCWISNINLIKTIIKEVRLSTDVILLDLSSLYLKLDSSSKTCLLFKIQIYVLYRKRSCVKIHTFYSNYQQNNEIQKAYFLKANRVITYNNYLKFIVIFFSKIKLNSRIHSQFVILEKFTQ